ncbi:MAG: GNAT family N-acetyltransferase [Oscillospiraceae bacterium]|nr:GNAT family N-acetyltransferase [Oscillospiraceae bacterium]
MELYHLSAEYFVRKLNNDDINIIYNVCMGNTLFYRFHPPLATKESIMEDMQALPPDKGYDDKFYIGFFKSDKLVALMDFIRDYPEEKVIFIGFFMVDQEYHGKGVGTRIIDECCFYWKSIGYQRVRLGIDKGNPQSSAFWRKNNFVKTSENRSNKAYDYVLMERAL